jgi:hypothetical protein
VLFDTVEAVREQMRSVAQLLFASGDPDAFARVQEAIDLLETEA